MSEFDELEGLLSEQAEEAIDPRIGIYDGHPAEVNHDGARV